jgi:hypothetical protein
MWADALNQGHRLVAVGGSDVHDPVEGQAAIGRPGTLVWASMLSEDALVSGLKSGRVFIRTAGGRDDFPAYLIGGSLTNKLWNESHGADQKRWDTEYAKAVHPLDYFTLQPRDFNVPQEADHATHFIKLIREKSVGMNSSPPRDPSSSAP